MTPLRLRSVSYPILLHLPPPCASPARSQRTVRTCFHCLAPESWRKAGKGQCSGDRHFAVLLGLICTRKFIVAVRSLWKPIYPIYPIFIFYFLEYIVDELWHSVCPHPRHTVPPPLKLAMPPAPGALLHLPPLPQTPAISPNATICRLPFRESKNINCFLVSATIQRIESRLDSEVDITVCVRMYDSRAAALLPYSKHNGISQSLYSPTHYLIRVTLQKFKFEHRPHTDNLGERLEYRTLAHLWSSNIFDHFVCGEICHRCVEHGKAWFSLSVT